MLILISIVTFAAVASLASYLLQPRQQVVRQRILDGATPNELARRRSSEGTANERLLVPVLRGLGDRLSRLLPQNLVRHIQTLLRHAGEPMSTGMFFAVWLIASGGAAVFTAWLVSTQSWGALPLAMVGGLVLTYGALLPYALLRRRASKRKREIERALPDAIDLLLTSVEAGLAVDAAFSLVAQRTRGALGAYLTEYLRQVGLGRSRTDALDDIAERSGAVGLTRLSAIVAQAGAVGTSMGDVLRIQAAELREARRLRAQEAAARAPIWMTVPLALCFMPAMGAVIVVPSILNLLEHVGELGLR